MWGSFLKLVGNEHTAFGYNPQWLICYDLSQLTSSFILNLQNLIDLIPRPVIKETKVTRPSFSFDCIPWSTLLLCGKPQISRPENTSLSMGTFFLFVSHFFPLFFFFGRGSGICVIVFFWYFIPLLLTRSLSYFLLKIVILMQKPFACEFVILVVDRLSIACLYWNYKIGCWRIWNLIAVGLA